MVDYNDSKTKYSVIFRNFSNAMKGIIAVHLYGAQKYSEDGYKDLPDEQFLDAAYRHLEDIAKGNLRDIESQEHHISHALWNIAVLAERIAKRDTRQFYPAPPDDE